MSWSSFCSVALAVVILSGCYASHDPLSGPDIRLPDAGRMTSPDAARVAPDAARVRRDAARPRSDAGLGCAEPVPEYDGPGCEPATGECLRSCMDEFSCNECFESDPECIRCVNTVIISCSNEAGCGDLWSDFACCASRDPECAGLAGVDLVRCAGGCERELAAYSDCVNSGPAEMCSGDIAGRCGVF